MAEQSGVIEQWDDQKGFGFIANSQGKRVFFHISVMRGEARPAKGEQVLFQTGNDERGRVIATHVRSAGLAIDNPRIRIKPKVPRENTKNSKIAGQAKSQYLAEHKIPWLTLLILLILPVAGALNIFVVYAVWWVFLAYVFFSLLAYYFYWSDKRSAKRSEWRIPEASLHFWSLLGGWPGAFVAQQQFRHKTRKISFQIVFWLTVIAHQVLWFDWLFMDSQWLTSLLLIQQGQ